MRTIALASLLGLGASPALAADAFDIGRAVDRTLVYVDDATDLHPSLGLAPDSSSLLGARLRARSSSAMTVQLEALTDYVFLAKGPEGVDLDIVLVDDDGDLVAADREDDEAPVVAFQPERSGPYTVQLINASSRSVYAVMAMLSSDGLPLRLGYMRQSLAPLLADAHRAMEAGAGVDEEGGWSFMATLLSENETHRFSGLPTRGRPGLALARGDSDARDIDLVVRSGGRRLGEDIASDAIPRVSFRARRSVEVAVTGHRIDRPSLVGIVLLLEPERGARQARREPEPSRREPAVATLRIFTAAWCPACGNLLRSLVAANMGEDIVVPGRGRVEVEVIDIDQDPRAARAMRGDSLPELQLVEGGRVVEVSVGSRSPSDLRAWLRRQLPART